MTSHLPKLPPPYVESEASARMRRFASGPTVGLKTPEAWSACYAWAIPHALGVGLATAWIASAGRDLEPRDFVAGIAGAALGWTAVSLLGMIIPRNP
jgi:hypothetical protein